MPELALQQARQQLEASRAQARRRCFFDARLKTHLKTKLSKRP
jgi:hypothetical protein